MSTRVFAPLESPEARISRVYMLEDIAIAGLPNSGVNPHDFYDACEDIYPDTRQAWPTRAKNELGFSLLTDEETDAQDLLDEAIVRDYYQSDLDTETFMSTPELARIRHLARKLLRIMTSANTYKYIDEDAWREAREHAIQLLDAFPDPSETSTDSE